MAVNANYAATPKVGVATVSTANTALDGTGTLATVFTAGASGSRIDNIQVKAIGATTAGIVRIFLHNGTTAFLLSELAVLTVTPSSTINAFEDGRQLNIVLQTGWSLRASTSVAQSLNVVAIGGDF